MTFHPKAQSTGHAIGFAGGVELAVPAASIIVNGPPAVTAYVAYAQASRSLAGPGC